MKWDATPAQSDQIAPTGSPLRACANVQTELMLIPKMSGFEEIPASTVHCVERYDGQETA